MSVHVSIKCLINANQLRQLFIIKHAIIVMIIIVMDYYCTASFAVTN